MYGFNNKFGVNVLVIQALNLSYEYYNYVSNLDCVNSQVLYLLSLVY